MPITVTVGPDSFRRTGSEWPAHVKLSDVWSSGFSSLVSLAQHVQITKSQNELYSRFCILFSESSTVIPALLPCSLLPRQARGTLRKWFTNLTFWDVVDGTLH